MILVVHKAGRDVAVVDPNDSHTATTAARGRLEFARDELLAVGARDRREMTRLTEDRTEVRGWVGAYLVANGLPGGERYRVDLGLFARAGRRGATHVPDRLLRRVRRAVKSP